MDTTQLLDYIRQQLQQNVSKDDIRRALIEAGWDEKMVEEAFGSLLLSNTQMHVPPESQRGIRFLGAIELLKNAWAIYRERLRTFVGISFVPFAIGIIVSTIVILGLNIPFKGASLFAAIFAGFALVTIIIAFAWSQAALIHAIKDDQERVGVKEAYRRSWHHIWSYLWIKILINFIIFFVTLLALSLLIIPSIIWSSALFSSLMWFSSFSSWFGQVVFALVLLLFMIPSIVLYIWFSMAVYILVAEDVRGTIALSKSREYIRGRWWGVFWRIIFITFLSTILLGALYYITLALKIKRTEAIIQGFAILFVLSLLHAYLFSLYKNLKSLRGAFSFSQSKKSKAIIIIIALLGVALLAGSYFAILRVQKLLPGLIPSKESLLKQRGVVPLNQQSGAPLELNNPLMPGSVGEKAEKISRDGERVAGVSQIRSALELYFDDHGFYPSTDNLESVLVGIYLTTLPKDPVTNKHYGYSWSPQINPVKFQVWAELESSSSRALSEDNDINTTGVNWFGNHVNGKNEQCTPAPNDCVYDIGLF